MATTVKTANKRVLIVGLGIAGMSAAIALKQKGWSPVIIERAKQRRTGGYFIGLQKAGQEAAQKLGIFDNIHTRNPKKSVNWEILGDGSRIRVAGFADQITQPKVLLRGDAEAGLWQGIEKHQIEVRFDTVPVNLKNIGEQVQVELQQGETLSTEYFDLVVGADGMRSTVRCKVFGTDEHFLHPVGAMICAYQLDGAMPNFPEQDGIMLCQPNRSVWVFPLGDHTPTVLFNYRTQDINAQFKKPAVETLKEVFVGMDEFGIVDKALDDLAKTEDYLFDSVNLVKMPTWSKGRIVLVGDSAWCLSLYSGMGATAGIKGGYELAEAIGEHDDVNQALAAWEKKMRPFVFKHQVSIPLKSQVFVPSSTRANALRRVTLRIAGLRLLNKKKKDEKQSA